MYYSTQYILLILIIIHASLNQELPLGYLGRPNISGCGAWTDNMSAFIDTVLKPYMEKLPSYV